MLARVSAGSYFRGQPADHTLQPTALVHEALKNTELAAARVDTIRLELLKAAARVVVSVRRVMLHLCSTHPYQQLLTRLVPI